MAEIGKLEEDLGYVRRAIETERGGSPAAIYYLWAVIVLVGFAMVDLAVEHVDLYWTIAAPVGFVASAFLGWRSARATGRRDRVRGMSHLLHWGTLLGAIALSLLPVAAGVSSWGVFAHTVLLLSAVAYVLAGLHLDRPLLWVGLVLAAGYVAVLFIPGAAWSLTGVLVAAALVAAGLMAGRRSRDLAG